MGKFSPAEIEAAKAIFEGRVPDKPPCPDCGGVHARACPRIRRARAVLNAQGLAVEKEVEYWAPGTWEDDDIIWPGDVYDSDDASSGDDAAD